MKLKTSSSSPITWMIKNPIPVNFLMLFFLIGGYFCFKTIKREVFPRIDFPIVTISVSYPGAQPEEIKRSIVQTIEAEIQGLQGIKKITSVSRTGRGTIIAELQGGTNRQNVYLDIKNAVDSINTLPSDSRPPTVRLSKRRALALSLVFYGQQPFDLLHKKAEEIQDSLRDQKDISLVELINLPKKQIIIQIKQNNLRKYKLTLADIASKINQYSRELSAGTLRTNKGQIRVKTNSLKEFAKQFHSIPVLSSNNGNILYLSDIASIKEGYSENTIEYFYNGLPAITINIYSVEKESPITIAKAVKKYLANFKQTYGDNIKLDILEDASKRYKGRIDLLAKNALTGLILVLLVLGLFLEVRLAFWVMLGLPISILGSFLILKYAGGSLNMVSLFAFIVTLGIVVDDAIIVGESIYEKRLSGESFLKSAIWGTKEMFIPVTFAILTNMVAFAPLLFVPGTMGDILFHIPIVTISVFLISLIECLFILPSHLAYKPSNNKFWSLINSPQKWVNKKFVYFSKNHFRKIVSLCIRHRYITATSATAILILSLVFIYSGYIKLRFLPQISRDVVKSTIHLTEDATLEEKRAVAKILTKSAQDAAKSYKNSDSLRGVFTSIRLNDSIKITTHLPEAEKRNYSSVDFATAWKEKTPLDKIAKLKSSYFIGRVGFGRETTSDIKLSIIHPIKETQQKIVHQITKKLKELDGVRANNTLRRGRQEFSIKLNSNAYLQNISSRDIARQIRHYIYGNEALRFQRDNNEITVLVRLPKEERSSISALDQMVVRTAPNTFSQLKDLVTIEEKFSASRIRRTNSKTIYYVNANIDAKKITTEEIIQKLTSQILPQFKKLYPDFQYKFEGEGEARKESFTYMPLAFLSALGIIYALLSIALGSYTEPFIVMISIPFGIIGAIIGHVLLGYSLSIISMIGIIGLSGVVINDSLVFITTFNTERKKKGNNFMKSAITACTKRLRPILLTSITTFFGLLPMLFETSIQAKFLIPMAISISFGIILATFIILVFIPCLCVIFGDLGFIKTSKPSEKVS